MTAITLDPDTADRVRDAAGPVTFHAPDGTTLLIGTRPPAAESERGNADGFWSEEDVAEALRRLREPGPRRTREQVWARIFAEHGRPEDRQP